MTGEIHTLWASNGIAWWPIELGSPLRVMAKFQAAPKSDVIRELAIMPGRTAHPGLHPHRRLAHREIGAAA